MSEGTPGTPFARYFQTGPYVIIRRSGLSTDVQIVPPVHAKTFGSRQTACGLTTDAWVKAWATPFGQATSRTRQETA